MKTTKSLVVGVAHEISTPIGNALLANDSAKHNLNHLAEAINTKVTRSQLRNIITSAQQALEVGESSLNKVAKLLDHFKKVDAEQPNWIPTNFSLISFFNEFKDTVKSVLGDHRLELDIVDTQVSLPVQGLSQVIMHLVENSLVHGFADDRQGMINITTITRSNALIINYQDNGVGIDEALQEDIFEPFFVKDRDKHSTGLGLNIVNNIVRQSMKGQITLKKSPINGGARFEIIIPLTP